jgi:raffinose/stachyose/melibiose transport system substrate-binding protein
MGTSGYERPLIFIRRLPVREEDMRNPRLNPFLLTGVWITLGCAALFPAGISAPAPAEEETASHASAGTNAPTATPRANLKILVVYEPEIVDALDAVNADFMADHPEIAITLETASSEEYERVAEARVAGNGADILMVEPFTHQRREYMKNIDPPYEQRFAETGVLLDLTGRGFLDNYYPEAIAETATLHGKVYQIPIGLFIDSGLFINADLFAEYGVGIPGTWAELIEACAVFHDNDIGCIATAGGDGWPIIYLSHGILFNAYPDQKAFLRGLWTGSIRWNDDTSVDMWGKMLQLLGILESGAADLTYADAPSYFAEGHTAMYWDDTWNALPIEAADPPFTVEYIPFPGGDVTGEHPLMAGGYHSGLAVAASGEMRETAIQWMAYFSSPDHYAKFIDIYHRQMPVQPDISLTSPLRTKIQRHHHIEVCLQHLFPATMKTNIFYSHSALSLAPFGAFTNPKDFADSMQMEWENIIRNS